MTEPVKRKPANQDLIAAVWEEARDLIKRLEGSSVQRFAVEAGGTRIEIERGIPSGVAPVVGAMPAVPPDVAEEGGEPETDARHPIKAPLVGTFYRAGQPGADPFVKVGDVVEPGQTVAIVEAMKLMNQVQSEVKGAVAEILVEDGQWVEFEQVLIYLDLDSGGSE
jgi:acetyl-CoA carboxylase biotin carboxyl carrier protein